MSLLNRLRNLAKNEGPRDRREEKEGREPPHESQNEFRNEEAPDPGGISTEPPAGETSPSDVGEEESIEALLQRVEQIDDLIGDGESESGLTPMEVVLSLTVSEALNLVPPPCRARTAPGDALSQTRISVPVPEALEQLATGTVRVSLGTIAAQLPPELLSAEARIRANEPIDLPLARVVEAIPLDLLQEQIETKPERELGLDVVPDPFSRGPAAETGPEVEESLPEPGETAAERPRTEEVSEPSAPPAAVAREPEEAAEPPAPEPVPSAPPSAPVPVETEIPAEPEVPAEPERPRPAAEVPPRFAPVPEKFEPPFLFVKGVDINRASRRDLVRSLPGVGPVLARRIHEARPFRTVFELAEIEGVGRRMFHRMTGEHLPLSEAMSGLVNDVLGPSDQPLPPLREVARRIASLPGIHGCLLSHVDGNILAAAGTGRRNKAFCAIAPQIMKSIDKYLALLKFEPAEGVTLFLDPKPMYITRAGNVFLVVSVPRTRFSLRRIVILDNILAEIVRRMQVHRGPERPEASTPASP